MLKKAAFVFLLFMFLCMPVKASERDIIFIEDLSYKDLYSSVSLKRFAESAVKGLLIQRSGVGEFAFFKGIALGRPAKLLDKDVPVCNGDMVVDNLNIYGCVEKDGTFYVPSKVLLEGQTSPFENNKGEKINIYHLKSIVELESIIDNGLEKGKNSIIICSWVRNSKKTYDRYLMPFIYYDAINKGTFYSDTTRNAGILDYSNAASLMGGKIENVKIVKENIENIYSKRIQGLKDKRVFLTGYAYFMGVSAMLNIILLQIKNKRWIYFFSRFVLFIPIAVLIEPVLRIDSIALKVAFIAVFCMAIAVSKKRISILKASAAFLIIIYLDALGSNFLLKNSLLSYEPALGARFYGIGNEYLGIILAYSLIIISEKENKYSWALWFLNSLLLIYNNGGSNFGGFLTTFVLLIINSPISIVLFVLVFSIIIIISSSNHIGAFFKNALSGNFEYAFDIIKSKLSTMFKLLKINLWTELSIIWIFTYLYIFLRKKINWSKEIKKFLLTCVLVTIFNDSGIVACAILMAVYINYLFYNIASIGYYAIKE